MHVKIQNVLTMLKSLKVYQCAVTVEYRVVRTTAAKLAEVIQVVRQLLRKLKSALLES